MQHAADVPDTRMTYNSNPEKEDIEIIIAKHSSLVRKIAWHVYSRTSSAIEVADLIQIGMAALVDGARRFEDRGIDFAGYANARVRGAMVDELRREAKITRSGMMNRKKLNNARKKLEEQLGRSSTSSELASFLKIPIEEYYDLESRSSTLRQESIDETYTDHDMWFADLNSDPFHDLEVSDTARRLAAFIAMLPEKQAMVLQLYFVEEMNLEEIGQTIGVGAARACQIKKKALEDLRELWQQDTG